MKSTKKLVKYPDGGGLPKPPSTGFKPLGLKELLNIPSTPQPKEEPSEEEMIKTLHDLRNYKKPYVPNNGVKNMKQGLAAANLAVLPFTSTPWGFAANKTLGAMSAMGDLVTAEHYFEDGQYGNGMIDLTEALLDVLPYKSLKTKKGAITLKKALSTTDKIQNGTINFLKAASFADDLTDPYRMQGGGNFTNQPVYHSNGDLIGSINNGKFVKTISSTGLKPETVQWLTDDNNVESYLKQKYGQYYQGRGEYKPAEVPVSKIDYSQFPPDRTVQQRKPMYTNDGTTVYQDTYGDGRKDVSYEDKKTGQFTARPWLIDNQGKIDYKTKGSLDMVANTKSMEDVLPLGMNIRMQIGGHIPAQIPENLIMPVMMNGGTNGQMMHDYALRKFFGGDEIVAQDQPKAFTPTADYSNQEAWKPVITAQQTANKKQAKPNQFNGVAPATMLVGAMDFFANQMENVPDSKVTDLMRQRGTSDAQFGTYNPTMKRGFIDPNSGMMVPDRQTLTQFGNQPVQNYYGSPTNIPFMAAGGSMLPDMIAPPDDAPVIPMQPRAVNPMTSPDAVTPFPKQEGNGNPKADFLTYMSHQQGVAGVKALAKAAQSGKDWKDFYKGPENLDTNMRSNINQQEFFKKYDSLNPSTFMDYWQNKFNKQASKWSGKQTKYDDIINQLAPQFGFDPSFVKTVIGIESGFKPDAQTGSFKGLLQINDKEAKKNGVDNIYDPYQNVMAGLKMMANNRNKISNLTQYKEGGEYELDEKEIKRLRDMGYEIEVSH